MFPLATKFHGHHRQALYKYCHLFRWLDFSGVWKLLSPVPQVSLNQGHVGGSGTGIWDFLRSLSFGAMEPSLGDRWGQSLPSQRLFLSSFSPAKLETFAGQTWPGAAVSACQRVFLGQIGIFSGFYRHYSPTDLKTWSPPRKDSLLYLFLHVKPDLKTIL